MTQELSPELQALTRAESLDINPGGEIPMEFDNDHRMGMYIGSGWEERVFVPLAELYALRDGLCKHLGMPPKE